MVDEIHRPLLLNRGLFVRGKFDLYRRDASCLLQSFESLILQFLSMNTKQRNIWKTRIENQLGENASIIIEYIPSLEKLIGKKSPVPQLLPSDTNIRFQNTFLKFVNTFATSDQPLVIFIDDLQW